MSATPRTRSNAAAHARVKIAFLVRSLSYGGAERQLVTLATALRSRGHSIIVIVFYAGGALEADLRAADVPVHSLEKRGRWDVVPFLSRLHHMIRDERPDVLHGYLGGANIMSVALRPVFPGLKIVWGERASKMDLSNYDWAARVCARVSSALSRFPDLTIVNSHSGFEYALACGYPRARLAIVPNGIDTERFAPDAGSGHRVRREWNVGDEHVLLGLIARFDPVKDHGTFLHAAALLAKTRADLRFVCVGDGDSHYRQRMQELAKTLGVADRCLWPGARSDMQAVYNALDVACSSSESEGFPNVVAEAMACGIPCVVTDVGDSRALVGHEWLVAPPRDAAQLAERVEALLVRDAAFRAQIREDVRNRIVAHFSVRHLTDATEDLIVRLAHGESP